MNKDMINIDDFVRDKLGGHEEKEDPAAWLRMKELLDKDMPERAVPFWFRMGKPLGFMGCALLVAALCVGGYKMMEHGNRDLATGAQMPKANGMMVATNGADHAEVSGDHAVPAVNDIAATTPNNNNNPAASTATTNNTQHTAATKAPAVAGGQSAAAGQAAMHSSSQSQKGTAANIAQSNGANSAAATRPANTTAAATNSVPGNTAAATGAKHNNTGAHRSNTGTAAHAAATSAASIAGNRAGGANNQTAPMAAASGNKGAMQQQTTTAASNPGQVQGGGATTQRVTAANTATGTNSAATVANRSSVNNTRLATSGIQPTGNAPAQPHTYANGGLTETKPGVANGLKPALVANSNNNNTAAQQATSFSKDSAASMNLVQRTKPAPGVPRKMVRITDTTGTGKVALATQEPANANNNTGNTAPETQTYNTAKNTGGATGPKNTQKTAQPSAANKEQVLAAQTPANTPATGGIKDPAPAAPENKQQQTTVAEAKKKERADLFGFLRNGHVREIVNNVKYDVGHAQFYYGVSAGANRSVSSSVGFTGMQLGVTGEFVFNKHLSLMAELKYFNRMGNKKVVNDDYTKVRYNLDSTSGGYNYFTMKTDSTSHFFNFSMLHSFEMPLTLRYAIHKFYIMTGVNLAYYLGINTEEGEKRFANVNQQQVKTEQNKPLYTEKKSYVTIDDFSSRFGIGYVFGAGYQINPSLQLDLRMTNSLWDNASTQGAKQVSQNFYKIPSFQLTLGYQFNRDRGKPTFGPTP